MKKQTYLILFVAFAALTVITAAAFVVLYVLNMVAGDSWLSYALVCGALMLAALASVFGIVWDHAVKSEKILLAENVYNLGKPNHFYDYQAFAKKVKDMKKKLSPEKESYMITFTSSHYSMMKNSSRNPTVTELNGYIADYLTETFITNKELGPIANIAFCFYHGQFLIYVIGNKNQVTELIDKIQNKIYSIVENNSIKMFVQPFFGIALYQDEDTLPMVIDNVFLARDISEKNFDAITIYDNKFRKTASKSELQEIKDAIENEELVVYYQPKYNLASKTFISAEALVRWNSRKYGLVSPAKFIEKAELGGLIHELDMYVFEKVCKDLGEMKKDKKRMVPVSVNFSIYEFYSPTFLDDVDRIIKASDINPSMVEIEITETTSQANPFLAISILKKLKEYGLKILMDDFGLGYSNLGTLNKIPFDTIKIDKSFIDGIVSDLKAREIVKFLISLCKTNGMEVIAEGVDKAEQVEILKKIRCDTIQGFYYSEPLPKPEFEAFLEQNDFEKKEA